VTRARVLLARGKESDIQLAMQILDVVDEITERMHNTRYKIEILALRSLALEAQGETAEAGRLNRRRPGAPGLYPPADLGEPMQAMLRRLADQGHSVETVGRILAAFPMI
jgi:hypothetical protein